jgi:hypothetical protein
MPPLRLATLAKSRCSRNATTLALRMDLVEPAGNVAHRDVYRADQAHQRDFLRLADVEQDERAASVEEAPQLHR